MIVRILRDEVRVVVLMVLWGTACFAASRGLLENLMEGGWKVDILT